MLTIIQVSTDSNFGGAGSVILNFLKNYNKEEFRVITIVPRGSVLKPMIEELSEEVIEVDDIGEKSLSLKAIQSFKDVFRKLNPNIVHTHSSLSARIAAKSLGIKIVYTKHWLEHKKHGNISKTLNNYLCDKAVAVSNGTKQSLIRMGIKEKKIEVIYNGISPLRRYQAFEKKECKERMNFGSSTVVANISRLESVKDIHSYLRCCKYVLAKKSDVIFLVVGTGSLENELKEYSKQIGIEDNVKFLGFIKDMEEIYCVTDIVVVSSKEEALSMAVIESMHHGIPVVATKCGGPEELIENEVTGFLVPIGDSDAMGERVLELSNKRCVYHNISEATKKEAIEKYTGENMCKELSELYKKAFIER